MTKDIFEKERSLINFDVKEFSLFTITYNKDGQKNYEGEKFNGKLHGKGIVYLEGRKVYEGEFYNGYSNGEGTYYFKTGNRYVGEFKDNQANGKGIFYLANGDRLDGEFSNWRLHGKGIIYTKTEEIAEEGIYNNGVLYEGKKACYNGNNKIVAYSYYKDGKIIDNIKK